MIYSSVCVVCNQPLPLISIAQLADASRGISIQISQVSFISFQSSGLLETFFIPDLVSFFQQQQQQQKTQKRKRKQQQQQQQKQKDKNY
jgi:hypothetical protein